MNVDTVFISELEKMLVKINNGTLPLKDKLGKIGEKFVKEGIKYYFWEKGFRVDKVGNETFNIGGPYKPIKGGMGGIDFHLEFRYNGIPNDCYIEVKNWRYYTKLSPTTFNTEILDRFTKNAGQSNCERILTMNKRNYQLIQQGCQQNNIHIVPLEEHITSRFLNPFDLKHIMEVFLDEFSIIIDKIVGTNLPNSPRKAGISIPDQIKGDIRLGKSYSLLAAYYNKSVSYIQKIKSQMKSKGEVLIKRSTKEWDGMQFRTR